MKSSSIFSAVTALCLSVGSVSAFAQGSGVNEDRNAGNTGMIHRDANGVFYQDHSYRRADGSPDHEQNRASRNNYRRDYNRGYDRNYNQNRYYYGARGPEWRRGGYIPREYYSQQYYVNDWRGHRLYAPPRGHQWVQVGGDYVLIALATGLIANLVLSQ